MRLVKQLAVGAALLGAGALIGFSIKPAGTRLQRCRPSRPSPSDAALRTRRASRRTAAPSSTRRTWDGTPQSVYSAQPGSPESRLARRAAARSGQSPRSGEMLVTMPGGRRMLARLPIGSGAPRELVEGVRDADWAPNGDDIAVLRTIDGRESAAVSDRPRSESALGVLRQPEGLSGR